MSDDEQFDSEVEDDSVDDDSINVDETEETISVGDSASSLLAKERERQKLQADIEAFLAAGGQIQTIGNNIVGDPPKKPEVNYGGQPI